MAQVELRMKAFLDKAGDKHLEFNCVERFLEQSRQDPSKAAIWEPSGRITAFWELASAAAAIQKGLTACGVERGDKVLVFAPLGATLYAAVIAIIASGASVLFVEPWMPLEKITHIVEAQSPKAFITDWRGKLWGLRSSAIRGIPHWLSLHHLARSGAEKLFLASVTSDDPAMITFTSGSSGLPKGVVRPHGYLSASLEILARNFQLERQTGADLCIFANFTLINLALGKPTLLLGGDWSAKTLKNVARLKGELAPESLTCGPSFLEKIMENCKTPLPLKNIHVGGALSDCGLIEKALKHWPNAKIHHVYGSTEAEPVAIGSAIEALERSKANGYHQVLWLGYAIAEIQIKIENEGLWVSGANVCPAYIMADQSESKNKFKDASGQLWHFMGDLVRLDPDGSLWFAGRSHQARDLFEMEQRLYQKAKSSAGFIHVDKEGRFILIAEKKSPLVTVDLNGSGVFEVVAVKKIYRDNRHRARLDRLKTLEKGAKWLLS